MRAFKILTVILVFAFAAAAQENLPVIRSNSEMVTIQDGEELKKDGWRLAPEAKPDVYEAQLVLGKPHKVTFITDVEQISFTVEEGKKYDFIIKRGNDLCYTQIVGTRFVPAAVFDAKYQKKHKGGMFVEVPEVYELVNVAIAMTPTGIADKNLVYQNSGYYKNVRAWFDKYSNHPLLAGLNAELKKNDGNYFNLKMNGYAFEFDKKGRIVQSRVYDRTGWGNSNVLRPFLEQLQSFADETKFREFYKQNRATYEEQIVILNSLAILASHSLFVPIRMAGFAAIHLKL